MYKGYDIVKVGKIPKTKLKKAIKGAAISFTKDELAGNDYQMLVHPSNAKVMKVAQSKNKGISGIKFSEPEIMTDMEYHSNTGGSLSGGSIWDSIWRGLKTVGNVLKESGAATALADFGQNALTPIIGAPLANVGRQLVKNVTGVGINAAKEKRLANLAKARFAKKNKKSASGGSFLIN